MKDPIRGVEWDEAVKSEATRRRAELVENRALAKGLPLLQMQVHDQDHSESDDQCYAENIYEV